ncbi:N-acetylmuramoyl-L-alanine amidase family protein [Nosocomiicoccus sp. HMSC059G07]|uniref:peptidoglycan recognition protein family protein n=1 Tax=Nosocomiicoccus sp. HMSC059G07 TaxID=1739531 RepID=UPI0009F1C7A6|nr:N-acetylmuramoyl-L-alanine amidase [Nosocomiicoccus sp. HMSC059G07]
MAYKIVDMRTPSSMYPYKSPYAMRPTSITVHNTGNVANARNEVAYMNNNYNYVSYHVAIDEKEAVQAIPFNRNAFAAGDGIGLNSGNRTSIHIEICYSMDNGYSGAKSERYKKAEDNAALYIAHVLKQYGWGIDRLKRHYDWSRKDCPHKMHATNSYQEFRRKVQRYLDELNGKKVAKPKKASATKKETPKTFNKRKGRKARARAYAKGVVRSTNGKGAAYRRWSNETFRNRFGNDIPDGSVVYIFSTHKSGWARIYSHINKGWIHLDQVQITEVY